MYVIATAGHVDHGKSTLVRALTGINPDRLREEQEREMTIDLGFAWMTLPDGEAIGIVDVPGHIDFIENMLAGVSGIDLALLVIAADEGPMPQTREHLAILNLLRAPRAIVALTKVDMSPGPEWTELVSADIRALLAATPFAGAPIMPVSARHRQGLTELIAALQASLGETQRMRDDGALGKRDLHRPRLPVDRAFTIQGFGTVVTGTLIDGSFAIGDEVEVLPEGAPARIRGLQSHQQKLEVAAPGSRVAINLSGVSVEQVARGSVIARTGLLRSTTLVDVRLEVLPQPYQRAALKHNTEVKLFCGTSERMARVRLLNGNELAPGKSDWAQLELVAPVAAVNGDRFIIRLPSPSVTIGGGVVVDAHPRFAYRRHAGVADESVLARLEAPALADGGDLLWIDSRTLVVGRGFRTNEAGASAIRKAVEPYVEEVHVVDLPIDRGADYCLHTLSLISMLDRDLAVVSLPLMPVHLHALLRERGVELIEIDEGEWDSLAPNVLALGPRDVVMLAGNPRTAAKLRAAGCRVQEIEGSDVAIKGSGGPTCLTLPLQRNAI